MIIPTTCFNKIGVMTKPLRIVQGGSSAGKTYSILLYLIYYALKRNVQISIVAESVPVLKRGAYLDFLKILKELNLYEEVKHNKTDRLYQLNDSTFEFFGADDSDKLRGARRDILFINECNNVSFDAFQELNVRTRLFTFLDYNPTASFWVHTEILTNPEGCDFTIVTYKDNEFLDAKIRKEIESWEIKAETSDYWANRWKVMGLGELGIQQGSVFKDWKIIDELPINAELLGSGIDFGFSTDPTALISVYRYDGQIILNEVIYEKELLNKQIVDRIRNSDAIHKIIYADSAEPRTIAELKAHGLNVQPVIKGKDSINYGIQLMQQQPLQITASSTNLIKEFENYVWARDREGNTLSYPIDDYNHAIDATRYFFLMKMGNRSKHFSLTWKR
ncbi:terminase large subunit [Flavobacterium enshiense]|uniref:PBSX family phage terminase large subunit n=1 Tax=Flavobacterium enshiense TaxID=1341165 RepID=UPI00345D5646